LLVALLLLASSGADALRRIGLLLLGFLGGFLILILASRVTRLPLNPLAMSSSQTILFGTADYCWPPDLGVEPVGASAAETARLQTQKAWDRWRAFWKKTPADRTRSLLWRMTHSLVSAEQFPPQWEWPLYVAIDKCVRRWWWLAACAATFAAMAGAVGGRGRWRFVSLTVLAVGVLQGLLFGAEPRYVLPLLPVLILGLARTLPTVRWSVSIAAVGAAPALLLAATVTKVPDTASSDYAIVRGPGHVIRQEISPSKIPPGETAMIHVRILKPDPFALGFDAMGNGWLLAHREATDPSPHPAYFSWALTGEALRQARERGLQLEIRTTGDASAHELFFYYPVVPPLLDGVSTLDGERRLPSAYGGHTSGGMPIWIHSGRDEP
jgi:hypothetical protein